MTSITIIGFGETGRALVQGWNEHAIDIAAYDLKAADPAMQKATDAAGIRCYKIPEPALAGAELAFCFVTAGSALEAAKASAPFLPPDILWLDGSSCAPDTKRQAAQIIEAAGGRYVDMAIIVPVHSTLYRTPALLAGPHVDAASKKLVALDMEPTIAGPHIGDAASIKALHSITIKGIEAITAESLLAARRMGVEDGLLRSLQMSDPGWDWAARGSYNLEQMVEHGSHRAAELLYAAATLHNMGLSNRMAVAAAEWQAQLGALHLEGGADLLRDRADRILSQI